MKARHPNKKIHFQSTPFDSVIRTLINIIFVCPKKELPDPWKRGGSLAMPIANMFSYFDFSPQILLSALSEALYVQGVFFTGTPPKKLNYGKPRLGESTLT